MNHKHTCYCCQDVTECDWGYDDDECAIYDEPVVFCLSCWNDCHDDDLFKEGLALGIQHI